ncbi:MAG: radical SAM protein [Terriglobales bacterium]
MQITEIFHSIQGESSHAGRPCVFVRLTGCNLRCQWCDTEYSFHGGRRQSVDEVLAAIRAFPSRLVEITGGEPMLQGPEVCKLAERLLAEGYAVLLETSGERDLSQLPAGVVKIVDVKCPGSGEGDSFHLGNLPLLTPTDEVKFVLTDREDYEFARDFVQHHALTQRCGNVLFSPAFRKDAAGERSASQCLLDPRRLAEWILEDGLAVRLSLQIHKFIWDPALHAV